MCAATLLSQYKMGRRTPECCQAYRDFMRVYMRTRRQTMRARLLPSEAAQLGLATEPGWSGVFTRAHYPGAYPNGARIVKIRLGPGDAHPIGARATVLGSVGHPALGVGYFVEWDDHPRVAVFVQADKIEPSDG
jgi:hypothetical protein